MHALLFARSAAWCALCCLLDLLYHACLLFARSAVSCMLCCLLDLQSCSHDSCSHAAVQSCSRACCVAAMQSCSHAVMQPCRHAAIKSCSHKVMQSRRLLPRSQLNSSSTWTYEWAIYSEERNHINLLWIFKNSKEFGNRDDTFLNRTRSN